MIIEFDCGCILFTGLNEDLLETLGHIGCRYHRNKIIDKNFKKLAIKRVQLQNYRIIRSLEVSSPMFIKKGYDNRSDQIRVANKRNIQSFRRDK